jgi:hypothetical protein
MRWRHPVAVSPPSRHCAGGIRVRVDRLLAGGPRQVTASQLLAQARPGTTYMLGGTVLGGSVRRTGSMLYFRVRDPHRRVSVPVRYTARSPIRSPLGALLPSTCAK